MVRPKVWVIDRKGVGAPRFVIQVDDNSFFLLAELEARQYVALHEQRAEKVGNKGWDNDMCRVCPAGAKSLLSIPSSVLPSSGSNGPQQPSLPGALLIDSQLIYWS
jgi:hypothetical protein